MLRRTSSQNGSIGRYGSPPATTTSKLQLKNRTTITQNHQKSSWVEVWQLQNLKTTSIQTGKRGEDVEQADPSPMCVG